MSLKMRPNFLPFLYQTRTLQLVCRRPPTFLYAQKATFAIRSNTSRRVSPDDSIPFEFDEEEQAAEHEAPAEGTLTPTETEIFKGIFDDISQGRLPKNRKRPQSADSVTDALKNLRDAAEKTRSDSTTQFSAEMLKRYPTSLRAAAQTAFGMFELAPARPKLREMTELDEEEAKQMAEWSRYEKVRAQEKERVHSLMKACKTDVELWKVMEKEVFSLPVRLGIVDEKQPKKGKRTKKQPVQASSKDDKLVMDVHGPLYSQYLNICLDLFDKAFPEPSLLTFKVFPRIRELGLTSYVLGVSTSLFSKLAEAHWNRFGDAASALEAFEEMKALGLNPNQEALALVQQIREHLHSCAWGAQGPFVMAMMEAPPYDASLDDRLERMYKHFSSSASEAEV